jgi:ubiquinone/menaquinone biosynthesis C-methylase UbiE
MSHNDTYIYDGGESDEKRLKILNDVYNENSRKILLKKGLKNAKCVLDLGCGQGDISVWIANAVSPSTKVIAMDIDKEQLKLVQRKIEKNAIKNLTCLECSLLDLDRDFFLEKIGEIPDFIYCRWVLIHLNREEIEKGLKKIYNLMDQGGVVIHEEVTLKESSDEKTSDIFIEYINIFDSLAKKIGIDFNLGSELFSLVNNMGYKEIEEFFSKPEFNKQQKEFFSLDMKSAIPSLEKNGIVSEDYVNKLCDKIDLDNSPMTMVNKLVFGVK